MPHVVTPVAPSVVTFRRTAISPIVLPVSLTRSGPRRDTPLPRRAPSDQAAEKRGSRGIIRDGCRCDGAVDLTAQMDPEPQVITSAPRTLDRYGDYHGE